MSEPTTAAGRLTNAQSDLHEPYCRRWSGPFDDAARPCSCTLPEHVAAIEAEAAAAARTALLDELEVWARDGKQPMWRTARLAVLEWINRRRP